MSSRPRPAPALRSARRDQRERQLLAAALECISTRGLSDTTVQAVAAEAGMAVGSISQYFDSKSRLLTALLKRLSEEFERAWREALADCGPDPARRLAAFVRCYFEPSLCRRKKIAVWFAFWGEVKARPQYSGVCSGFDQRHDESLEALCAALIEVGSYRGLRSRDTAKLIASMCHGLWLELLTGRDGLRRAELARLALNGLAALFPRHASVFALEMTVPR
jgi:TetR/AcrR family transcriptional regulator, transcriptional repressor of bet genes